MKKTTLSAVIASAFTLALSSACIAQTPYPEMPAGVYNVDKTHASITWKVSHLGLSNYTARFTKFDASIDFDPNNVEASKITATIDPTSVRTDYPFPEKKDFDKKLAQGAEWFNAGAFPSITFASSKLTKTGDNTGVMEGNLTFLGVTKPVSLSVTLNGATANQPFSNKPTLGVTATTTIKRTDWGFSTYTPNIGDEVTIIIDAEFGKEG